MSKPTAPEPVFQTSPVRLSVDETRLLLRIAVAGKPVSANYHAEALADMGILSRTELNQEKDTAKILAECWQRARKGVAAKDQDMVRDAMREIDRIVRDRDGDAKYLFGLTDLGRQIVRGVSVRLNSQGKPK
jgi:hypothetical protein